MGKMDMVDILGFGNIVGAEEPNIAENEDSEEILANYVTEILYQFQSLPRVRRKQLIKLAKDVAAANRDIVKGLENGKNQSN